MDFLKKNMDKIVGLLTIMMLALFAFRIVLFLTYQEAEEGTFRYLMYDVLGVEAAAGEERPAMHPEQLAWSFEGSFGQYDMASVRRGLQVYRENCSACHSLDKIAFRNLAEIGYSANAAKAIAAEYTVTDGPDAYGDMFERAGRLTDYFPSPFANVNAAKAANSGTAPPDLSLITKARKDGPNYVYSILTGYQDAPAGFEFNSDVTNYNPYFPTREILMMAPLFEDMLEYQDGTEANVEQMAVDVTNFLMWTAEPNLDDRHKMGFKVTAYMVILTILMFFSMRVIWRRVKK
jgi:ubiquinol-cytochrome c reductase cytochrome c1 subunit